VTDRPVVHAVILTWNNFADTAECLEGLRRQSIPCSEVVVIDNGSTNDCAMRLSAAFPDVRVVSLPENLGYTGGANAGITAAAEGKPDYVLFLANDTVPAPTMLAGLLATAGSHPAAGMVGPRIEEYDAPGVLQHGAGVVRWSSGALGTADAAATMECDWLTGCGFLLKVEALDRIAVPRGFDPVFFSYWEDVDLSRRIADAGYTLVYEPSALLLHKESAQTRGRDPETKRRSRLYYMLRNQFIFARRHLPPLARGAFFIRSLIWHLPRQVASSVWHRGLDVSDLRLRVRAYMDGVSGRTGRGET
jgi:GT2 family glycosyltransferase